jgi:large subunit ribosomal protein L18
MNNVLIKRNEKRRKRTLRVRKKLRGNAQRPRMSVMRTNLHLSIQLIDDENGLTLASISTLSSEFKDSEFKRKNRASARKLGEHIANLAQEKQIDAVIFDRGRFKYHGVIAEVAEGARSAGLKF